MKWNLKNISLVVFLGFLAVPIASILRVDGYIVGIPIALGMIAIWSILSHRRKKRLRRHRIASGINVETFIAECSRHSIPEDIARKIHKYIEDNFELPAMLSDSIEDTYGAIYEDHVDTIIELGLACGIDGKDFDLVKWKAKTTKTVGDAAMLILKIQAASAAKSDAREENAISIQISTPTDSSSSK